MVSIIGCDPIGRSSILLSDPPKMVSKRDWENLKLLHSPQGYLSKKERKKREKEVKKNIEKNIKMSLA